MAATHTTRSRNSPQWKMRWQTVFHQIVGDDHHLIRVFRIRKSVAQDPQADLFPIPVQRLHGVGGGGRDEGYVDFGTPCSISLGRPPWVKITGFCKTPSKWPHHRADVVRLAPSQRASFSCGQFSGACRRDGTGVDGQILSPCGAISSIAKIQHIVPAAQMVVKKCTCRPQLRWPQSLPITLNSLLTGNSPSISDAASKPAWTMGASIILPRSGNRALSLFLRLADRLKHIPWRRRSPAGWG